jgi:hypothetical protein
MKEYLSVAMLAACVTGEPDVSSSGNAELGIWHFNVVEEDSRLQITGVDAQGAKVAEMQLRLDIVPVPEWPLPTYGRELQLEVKGVAQQPWTSAGVGRLTLPPPRDPNAKAFYLDPYVREVLDRWDIGWQVDLPAELTLTEVKYADSCGAEYFHPPCGGAGPLNTCEAQRFNEVQQTVVCNDFQHTMAERACVAPYQPTSCGGAGPGGCAVCWSDASGGNLRAMCVSGFYCDFAVP